MFNQRLARSFDFLGYFFLLLTVVAVPLFMDKNLLDFYTMPKQYALMGLVLASFLFFTAKVILTKSLTLKRTVFDAVILLFLGVALLSSIFSVNINNSFLGRNDFFVLSFVFLIFLGLFYFLFINFVNGQKRWAAVLDSLILVGLATSIIFVLAQVFEFSIMKNLFGSLSNTVDNFNSSFGLWTVAIFILSAGMLIKKELHFGKVIFYFVTALLSFVSLILLSFQIFWWLSLVGLVLLLLLGGASLNKIRVSWLSVLFGLLILVTVFIIFGTPKALQSSLPAEASLGAASSWVVSKDTVFSSVKNFLVGSGVGTFGYDFSMFRPFDFNYDSVAWSLRFNQPFSVFFALLSEGGSLLVLSFAFLFVFVLGHVLHTWYKTRAGGLTVGSMSMYEIRDVNIFLDSFLVVIVWVVLTLAMMFLFFGPVSWWLWWLLLSLGITGISFIGGDFIKSKTWKIEDTPQYSLSFSFVLIIIMAGVMMLGVWEARLYLAELHYSKGLMASDLETAETEINKAIDLRPGSDLYHVALAQVNLSKAVNETNVENPSAEKVTSLVAKAVNEAKKATELSPSSVAIWENLSTMYENAAYLAPEARDWAIKSLEQAIELEPSNPVLYWRLANLHGVLENWDKAIEYYEKAIALKSDYVSAYVGLSSVYEQSGNIDEAVRAYVVIVPQALNNTEVVFNYGRLLYNRNKNDDRDKAEKFWLEAVKINPNYSNALYSLGLYYETKGKLSEALKYFYKVQDLNPDNQDIEKKIDSLLYE